MVSDLFVTEDDCPYFYAEKSGPKLDDSETTSLPESDSFEFSEEVWREQFRNISFAGCGFMGVYHVGVFCAFKQFCQNFIKNVEKIYGCSAGTLMATALISELSLGEMTKNILDIVGDIRKRPLGPLHPKFYLKKTLREKLEKFAPENIHELASGKIFISLTRVTDQKSVIVSEYPTRADYLDAVECSCFVPFYSGLFPPRFRGVAYVDGGLTDNLPGDLETTIRISPFSGSSSISPKDSGFSAGHIYLSNNSFDLTLKNAKRLTNALFPPNHDETIELCRTGYHNALEFILENGLASNNVGGRRRKFTEQLYEWIDLENVNPLPEDVRASLNDAKANSERVTRKLMKIARFVTLPAVWSFYTTKNNVGHFLEGVTWLPTLTRFLVRKTTPGFVQKGAQYFFNYLPNTLLLQSQVVIYNLFK